VKTYYFMLIISILLNTTAQIFYKFGSETLNKSFDTNSSLLLKTLLLISSPSVLIGFSMALIGAIIWVIALSKLPLSHAYPFMAASFILVTVAGHFIFSEHLTALKALGVGFIILGLIIGSQG
jgi:multidrug transporter EmrE-like cation transporter